MSSKTSPFDADLTSDALDKLFFDCAELEALIASVRQTIEKLDPAVDAGLVTAEHLMNLAFRTENAQRGLIAIAHQISEAATTMIQRRQTPDSWRWDDGDGALSTASGCAKN